MCGWNLLPSWDMIVGRNVEKLQIVNQTGSGLKTWMSKPVKHSVNTKLSEIKSPTFPIFEGFHDIFLRELLGCSCLSILACFPNLDQLLILIGKEVSLLELALLVGYG